MMAPLRNKLFADGDVGRIKNVIFGTSSMDIVVHEEILEVSKRAAT